MTKSPLHVCKNCRLYSERTSTCGVRILHGGQTWRDVPVHGWEACLWEDLGVSDQIQEVRFWVEDAQGRPTAGNGTVKVQYPPGFFGPEGASPST